MAHEYGEVPESLIRAVRHVESGDRPNLTSRKGARHEMQVMPAVARNPGNGVRPARNNSADEYNRVGEELLAAYWDKYRGDVPLVAAAYNAGPGAVAKHGGVPPYDETLNYIQKVTKKMQEEQGKGFSPEQIAEFEKRYAEEQEGGDKPFSPEQISEFEKRYAEERAALEPEVPESEKPSMLGEAWRRGVSGVKQAGQGVVTGALSALGQDELVQERIAEQEAIAKAEAEREAQNPELSSKTFQEIQDTAENEGTWAALKKVPGYIGQKVAESAPSTATPLGVGLAAGMVNPALGVAAGITASIVQEFGFMMDRQIEKEKLAGKLEPEKAAIAAIPAGALDAIADRFTLGMKLPSFLTREVKEGALDTVTKTFGGEVAKHVGKGIIAETPTEMGQTELERWQAGEPLSGPENLAEVKEAGISAGVAGGAAGTLGGTASYLQGAPMPEATGEEPISDTAVEPPAPEPIAPVGMAPEATPPILDTAVEPPAPKPIAKTGVSTPEATAPIVETGVPTPEATAPIAEPVTPFDKQQAAELGLSQDEFKKINTYKGVSPFKTDGEAEAAYKEHMDAQAKTVAELKKISSLPDLDSTVTIGGKDYTKQAYIKSQILHGNGLINTEQAEQNFEALNPKGKKEEIKYSVENAPEYKASHRPPNIENGAPLHDVTKGGEIYPADIYSPKGLQYYGTGQVRADKESLNVIKNTKNKPDALVTMYRAVPKDSSINTINNGDWVTLSKTYAKEHGESALDDYKIISKQVKANELFTNGDSINEFGYWTEPTTEIKEPSYSTAPTGTTTGQTAESLSRALSPEMKQLVASGKAVLHDTVATLPGTGHPANVKGMTTAEGVTHYVANKLTPSTIESVALHEVGVHAGMEKMLGKTLWEDVKNQALNGQGKEFDRARAAVPKGTPDHLRAEETLAYLVEHSPQLSLVRRIVAAIRNFLRSKMGMGIKLSEADARQMATASMRREAKTAVKTAREETAYAEKQRIIGKSRKGLSHTEVLDRVPELAAHAKKMREADHITNEMREEHQRLVDLYKSVEPYETAPKPESEQNAKNALGEIQKNGTIEKATKKSSLYGVPSKLLKVGEWVQLRLDIPSYKGRFAAWVVTVHTPKSMTGTDASFRAGTPIGYESVAAATNVKFGVVQDASLTIATGKDKGTIATMVGQWKPMTPEEAYERAKAIVDKTAPDHAQWTQVGMDPERHSYFYDRVNQDVVDSADEVIQIGPLVLAKNVVWGDRNLSNRYSVGKDNFNENVPNIRKKANAIASFNREKLPMYLELFSAAGIREIGSKYLRGRPSEDGAPSKNSASEILKDTREITGMTNKLLEGYLDLRKQINKYIKENRRQVGILGDTANSATILEVSPWDTNPDSPNNIDNRIESELANQEKGYAQRVKDLKALKVSWGQLTPQSKAMYKKVADFYRESYGAYEEAERYRINSADMDADEKERQIAILDKKMEHTKLKGDYFPVMRFGNYAVQYTDGDINEDTGELIPKFSKFESEEEAREFIDNNPSIETKGVTKDILRDNSSVLTGNRSLDALWKSVDKKFEKIESTEDIAIVAGEMKDYLFQMHLMGRPEQSIAKRFLHRKGTAGYSNDIFRSFDTYALSMSKQLPRIKLSNNIMSKLDNLKHELPVDETLAVDYYNAFKKQITDSVYPKQLRGAINTITGAVFHYYLSAPASAALQLASIPLQGAPSIAKVHGVNSARRALNSAVGLYTSSMSKKTPFGDIKRGAEARKDIGNLVTGAKHADEFNLPDAMDKMRAEGLLLPSVHAQAFSGQNKPTSKSDSAFAKAKRVMEITSRPFAEAESAARQVSAAAAYIANMRSGMTHQDAIRSAIDTTYLDLGDFGATGQSSLVKTGFGGMVKIASQFQQYGAKLLFAFGKAGYDALKGESPEVRRQGIKFLGSLYAMHWLFAGALGLPGAGLAMSLTDFIRDIVGDKDERHSLEQDMRNAMRSSGLNNTVVKMILDGPVGTITNMNLTPRIGAGDLIPMIQESDLNETLKGDVVGDFGKTMLGAAGSTAANIMKASEAWTEGNYEQAIEKIMPAGIRNVMTAHRYATEGKLTPKGLPIVSKEEISTWDIVARALGMETMHMAEKSKAARSAHMLDKFIDDRKEFLYDKFAKATPKEQEKVINSLVKFAERHPGAGVSTESILSSLRGREEAKYKAIRGQMLGKNKAEVEEYIPELGIDED